MAHRCYHRRPGHQLAVSSSFWLGDWRVDPPLRTVTGASGAVRLEPKLMQVLVQLAERPGQVVGKEQLLQTVWSDTFVGDEVLSRTISELRRVFGDDPKSPRYIQTIPKGGYRLVSPVTFDQLPPAVADAPAVLQPRVLQHPGSRANCCGSRQAACCYWPWRQSRFRGRHAGPRQSPALTRRCMWCPSRR